MSWRAGGQFFLLTLQHGRPSILENAEACEACESWLCWLDAWERWYSGLELDEADLARKAAKKAVTVEQAWCGLLLFDAMCLSAVQGMFAQPFKDCARLTAGLAFANFTNKPAPSGLPTGSSS